MLNMEKRSINLCQCKLTMSNANGHNIATNSQISKVLYPGQQGLPINGSAIGLDFTAKNLSNLSLLKQLTELDNGRRLSPLIANQSPTTAGFCCFRKFFRMGRAVGQRPFYIHILSSLDAGQSTRVVHIDAGADNDQVNVFVVCDGLGVAIGFCLGRQFEHLDGAFRSFDAAVAEGYDLISFSAAGGEKIRQVGMARPC